MLIRVHVQLYLPCLLVKSLLTFAFISLYSKNGIRVADGTRDFSPGQAEARVDYKPCELNPYCNLLKFVREPLVSRIEMSHGKFYRNLIYT